MGTSMPAPLLNRGTKLNTYKGYRILKPLAGTSQQPPLPFCARPYASLGSTQVKIVSPSCTNLKGKGVDRRGAPGSAAARPTHIRGGRY